MPGWVAFKGTTIKFAAIYQLCVPLKRLCFVLTVLSWFYFFHFLVYVIARAEIDCFLYCYCVRC